MAKKNAARTAPQATAAGMDDADIPVVGMREPCPCGSGRRYKACHGRDASAAMAVPSRPFAGMASECDIVALRELVPAATAPLTLRDDPSRSVTLATVLPMAWPALVRADGGIVLALQVTVGSGDASRDLADALGRALVAEPGEPVALGRVTAHSPRLQGLVDPDAVLDITVHEDFEFWIEDAESMADDVRASLDRARSFAHPTARLEGVAAAYWTRMGEKEHLRWVMPHDEERLLDALARLHASGADSLGEGTKLAGMFRAQGLLCPVWDLPLGTGSEAVEAPAASFGERLAEALAQSTPLTSDERRARASMRQVTLR
ncbi:MAG: DUF5926 family protein [Actinomycetota bacterium]|nr:DUF5926 family protein [Actinomycetota bacterium]